MDRRNFFKQCGRAVGLTALTAGGAALLCRPKKKLSGQTCISKGICRGCNTFAKCNLPQAQSAKKVIGRQKNG